MRRDVSRGCSPWAGTTHAGCPACSGWCPRAGPPRCCPGCWCPAAPWCPSWPIGGQHPVHQSRLTWPRPPAPPPAGSGSGSPPRTSRAGSSAGSHTSTLTILRNQLCKRRDPWFHVVPFLLCVRGIVYEWLNTEFIPLPNQQQLHKPDDNIITRFRAEHGPYHSDYLGLNLASADGLNMMMTQ